ncbi:MAG: hypothetical protein HPY72_02610 [Anaerolineae bacterium]|nr:hypothetical protein [Anaerolineae bacterium]
MYQITIKVNGEEIYLTGYPSEIISEVILTMLKTLKGVEEIKNAVIEIKK